ncbi:hypothetical protein QBC46DRAFT_325210 [Diplogelasinospora grovesii]|uniref:Uncharacterized protein n=1 Tax=Diplogelasinospora grovesii TaxID=303347 RepID=A0AAN6MVS8_9PEZI|nr:hypothetical protein QBC46DRAFT_325210 [Diplogelasinospora grovesii]
MLAQDCFENPVNLTRIRRKYIDNAPADVLILLDCCHSGVASIGSNKEIIAAAASESMAYNDSVINQSESFTTGLIQQLQHAAATKQVMTSPQLYSRLATRALQHESRGRRTVPLHLHNYQQNRAPIYFAPLFNKDEWVATPNSIIQRQPVTVVLHAHLQDGTREAIEELTEWATRSRPPCANRIRIMDVIPSNSVTVIFEVTLDVWDSLPANASIWFVDFQRYTVATESSVVPGPSAVFPSPGLHGPVAPCVTQVPSVQSLGFAKYASGSKVSPFGQLKENVPPSGKAPWQQSPSKLKKDKD